MILTYQSIIQPNTTETKAEELSIPFSCLPFPIKKTSRTPLNIISKKSKRLAPVVLQLGSRITYQLTNLNIINTYPPRNFHAEIICATY